MKDREDPGLPITFGPCSNGEYDPEPTDDVRARMLAAARDDCDTGRRVTGINRREFLRSAAATLATLWAIDSTATAAAGRPLGGGYPIAHLGLEARRDPVTARTLLGAGDFVFDMQGHLLEHDLDPSTRGNWFWGSQFPQARCEVEDDPRACFSMNHFLEEMFIRSDTTMTALSGLPILAEGSPLPPEVMEETRRVVAALGLDNRILVNALALPQLGPTQAVLDEMERTVGEFDIAGWKTFTHFPSGWYLDNHDPDLPQVAGQFLDKIERLGKPVLCIHKGLAGGSRIGSPVDVGPAAKAHPGVKFVIYHSGFEVRTSEGPYTEETAGVGVNRLVDSLRRAGVGPGENVYAEMGSTWWHVMRRPEEAAHVLGKLLVAVGENNLLWGTDSIFYGSPQGQIDALRAFEISAEFQERFGYPALTREVKRKILGENACRLYGIVPVRSALRFSPADLEAARTDHPVAMRTWGPTTAAEVREFRRHHRGWP
ncbi:MAG: amidohydrolase family protein [Acidimicrobiia bacterium]